MIGQTISHYKILEKLGEGGMGVVYKAHDTKLDRDVALKFLPHHLTATADEQARFLQEARAASALNHPNVCVIHDIQEHQGQQFIVMEYVDGKTLRQMVPVQKMQAAIDYAIQIGEALQEAHCKGIVHRDIKTDNIMVNSKNQIKVMDFGLAKLKGSLKLTKTSSTVGTLAYMAPEQIQGGEVDARSDIFSFGVVLFEMLSGHLPFRGEHEAAMVYSIVNEEPQPIQKYLPEVSSEVLHILNRALEKDPEDRYQNIHEIVIDLRRGAKQTSRVFHTATSSQFAHQEGAVHERPQAKRSKKKIFYAGAGTLIALCAAGIFFIVTRGPQLNPDMKIWDMQIPFQSVSYGTLSKSGNTMVFPAADDGGKYDVYMMNVNTRRPMRITKDSCREIFNAFLSPDEGTILYQRTTSQGVRELVVTPLGGIGRVIKSGVTAAYGFCDDGKRVLYYVTSENTAARQTIRELWSCALDGSDSKLLFADSVARVLSNFSFDLSSDSRYIVWTKRFQEGFTEIMVRDVKNGSDRQITFDRKFVDDAEWTPFGSIIYASDRGGSVNLWMVSGGGGEPQQITRGPGPQYPAGISKDGKRLLYNEMQAVGQIKSMDLTNGSVRSLAPGDRLRSCPDVSASGKLVAFSARDQGAVSYNLDIFVMDRDGKNVNKVTDDASAKFSVAWSPDEKWIGYSSFGANEPMDSARVSIARADLPGQQRFLMAGTIAGWWNANQVIVRKGMSSFLYSVDLDRYEKTPEDSVFAYPVLNDKFVLIVDYRNTRRGFWITTMSSYQSTGSAHAALLLKSIPYRWERSMEGSDIYYLTSAGGELYRLKLPGGKSERIKWVPPRLGIDPFGLGKFVVHGKELFYTEYQRHNRYFLIDNLFK
jgi:Tol biopolymer transport system component/predicted Ser/Thr protein kinase